MKRLEQRRVLHQIRAKVNRGHVLVDRYQEDQHLHIFEVVSVLWIKTVILPNIVLNIDPCEGEERNLSSFCSASEALSPSTWFHPFSNESLVFPVVCPGVIS